MREIGDLSGITIGDHTNNNLRYADDILLIAISEKDLQHLFYIIKEKSQAVGLGLNTEKTVTSLISKKENTKVQFKAQRLYYTASGKVQISWTPHN